ncbi:MAG: DUF3073 domain-containing protein, partial [Pseudolysinimonas sp.]
MRGSRMGRGRQKAKHTKVARDLKYFSPDTNYGALQQELSHGEPGNPQLEEDLEKWPEYSAYNAAADDEELDEDESKSA